MYREAKEPHVGMWIMYERLDSFWEGEEAFWEGLSVLSCKRLNGGVPCDDALLYDRLIEKVCMYV